MTSADVPEDRDADPASRDKACEVLRRVAAIFPKLLASFPSTPERSDAFAAALERVTDRLDIREAAREAKAPARRALERIARTSTELRTLLGGDHAQRRLTGYMALNGFGSLDEAKRVLAVLAEGAEQELQAIANDALKEPGAPDLGSPVESFAADLLDVAKEHLGMTQHRSNGNEFALLVRAVEDVFQNEPNGRPASKQTAASLKEALRGRGSRIVSRPTNKNGLDQIPGGHRTK